MGTMHFLGIFISLSPPLSRLKARHCIGVAFVNGEFMFFPDLSL